MIHGDEVVATDCTNLRQGDVVEGNGLFPDGDAPVLAAILSQTCDVVQPSKSRCLIAPVIESNATSLRDARKGRKPLHLYLESTTEEPKPCIVDMEQALSVAKSELLGRRISARYVSEASSTHAGDVAERVGRAFNRFPFPDEVYPFFRELRSRVQSKSGTVSAFGQAVDMLEDLRIAADQWTRPGRRLRLYVVVPKELLIPAEDFDPNWTWSSDRILELRNGDAREDMTLHRICELILANKKGDLTTLGFLWGLFGSRLASELLVPNLSTEVTDCEVEVVSDTELNYRQFRRTVSLDLEVLSNAVASQTFDR